MATFLIPVARGCSLDCAGGSKAGRPPGAVTATVTNTTTCFFLTGRHGLSYRAVRGDADCSVLRPFDLRLGVWPRTGRMRPGHVNVLFTAAYMCNCTRTYTLTCNYRYRYGYIYI